MATITAVETDLGAGFRQVLWETLTVTNNDGSAVNVKGYNRGTVIIRGTFDSNTITLEGNIDGTNWATLKDEGGNAISTQDEASFTFNVACLQVRPLSASGTTVDVDVDLMLVG